MANRGEKHFRQAGNNASHRKYKNVIIVIDEHGNEIDSIVVSCRPARAQRALRKFRTNYSNVGARLNLKVPA